MAVYPNVATTGVAFTIRGSGKNGLTGVDEPIIAYSYHRNENDAACRYGCLLGCRFEEGSFHGQG